MVKKIYLIVVVACFCVFALTPVYADPLLNPGFETNGFNGDGSPTGWTELRYADDDGHNLVSVLNSSDGYISANEPTNYLKLFAGTIYDGNVNVTEVNQVINLSSGEGLSGVFAFDLKTVGITEYAYVQIHSDEGQQFYTELTGDALWQEWSWTVPDDGRDPADYRLRYGVFGVANYDTAGDSIASAAYFDTTYSQAVPEPATLILLMAGVLGIGIMRRKLN